MNKLIFLTIVSTILLSCVPVSLYDFSGCVLCVNFNNSPLRFQSNQPKEVLEYWSNINYLIDGKSYIIYRTPEMGEGAFGGSITITYQGNSYSINIHGDCMSRNDYPQYTENYELIYIYAIIDSDLYFVPKNISKKLYQASGKSTKRETITKKLPNDITIDLIKKNQPKGWPIKGKLIKSNSKTKGVAVHQPHDADSATQSHTSQPER